MAALQRREVPHGTLDEVCEAFDELAGEGDVTLIFMYDGVELDTDSIVRAENGAITITLQEA